MCYVIALVTFATEGVALNAIYTCSLRLQKILFLTCFGIDSVGGGKGHCRRLISRDV